MAFIIFIVRALKLCNLKIKDFFFTSFFKVCKEIIDDFSGAYFHVARTQIQMSKISVYVQMSTFINATNNALLM